MKICPQCGKRYPAEVITCQEDGSRLSALSDDPYLGYQLANFQLLERIGKGGFGVVYLAQHMALGNQVAVKILKKQYTTDQQLVERFRREARVSSQINHENVVHIVDFGYDNELGFYYIMEHLDGKSLTDVMKEHPRGMPLERLLPIMKQICSALEQAHAHSVVHRDLKPSNIFLIKRFAQEDVIKILDFGIAKVLQGEEGSNMTVTGQIVGSPRFMSPEQARGRHSEVDARSDIYSLGVILFWTMTGRLPFESKQLARLLYMHVKMPAPQMASAAPHIAFSPQLEAIVQAALAKRKDDRPSSAGELYQRFEQACRTQGSAQAPDDGPSMTVQMRPPSSASGMHGVLQPSGSYNSHTDYPSVDRPSYAPPPPPLSHTPALMDDPLESTQIDNGGQLNAEIDALLANDARPQLDETVNLPPTNGPPTRPHGLTSGIMSPPSGILSAPNDSNPSISRSMPRPPMQPNDEDATSMSISPAPPPHIRPQAKDTSPSMPFPPEPTPSKFSWKFFLLGLLILILLIQMAFIGWKLWQKQQKSQSMAPPPITTPTLRAMLHEDTVGPKVTKASPPAPFADAFSVHTTATPDRHPLDCL